MVFLSSSGLAPFYLFLSLETTLFRTHGQWDHTCYVTNEIDTAPQGTRNDERPVLLLQQQQVIFYIGTSCLWFLVCVYVFRTVPISWNRPLVVVLVVVVVGVVPLCRTIRATIGGPTPCSIP